MQFLQKYNEIQIISLLTWCSADTLPMKQAPSAQKIERTSGFRGY